MALTQATQAKVDAVLALLTTTGDKLTAASAGLAADIAALKAAVPDQTPAFNAALDSIQLKANALGTAAQALADLDAQTPGNTPPIDEV